MFPEDEPYTQIDWFIKNMKDNFYIFSKLYKKNIYQVSKSFSDAITQSLGKLVRDDVWNNIDTSYGTILNMGTILNGITALYYIKQDGEYHRYCFYYFLNGVWFGFSTQDAGRHHAYFSNTAIKTFTPVFKPFADISKWNKTKFINEIDDLLHTYIVAYINFIQYAGAVS